MPSIWKKQSISLSVRASSGSSILAIANDCDNMVPVELFGLIAMCERQKNPGEALLVKAKDLRWSLLAMIASCFPDVSPLSCLTVWLEITAARLEMHFLDFFLFCLAAFNMIHGYFIVDLHVVFQFK